jgi:uncharacterized protein YbbC (DUF1343 family)
VGDSILVNFDAIISHILMMRHFSILIFTIFIQSCAAQAIEETKIIVGAEQTEKYLPLLIGKNVGLFVNHTSRIGNTHLTDSFSLC